MASGFKARFLRMESRGRFRSSSGRIIEWLSRRKRVLQVEGGMEEGFPCSGPCHSEEGYAVLGGLRINLEHLEGFGDSKELGVSSMSESMPDYGTALEQRHPDY